MARGRVRLNELINEAGLDRETALISLYDSGVEFSTSSEFVPRSKLAQVRKALNLQRHPGSSDLEIRSLAAIAGKSEAKVRELLFEAGVIAKRRIKYLPHRAVKKAEIALGLRKSPEAIAKATARKAALQARKDAAPRKVKKDPAWRQIGPPQDLVFLAPSDVSQLHCVLVEDFARSKDPIEPPGVRTEESLGP